MGIVERYSRSINSSNLKSDEYHFDTDNLAAVALSSDFGGTLFRVKYGLDATSYNALFETWKQKVVRKSENRQWPKHISAKKVAEISLSYWLNDICEACSGKGFEMLPGYPVLSDEPCKCCQGSTKKPLVCESNWKDYILDMLEEMEDMSRSAAGRAMKKLAKDMEL